MKTSFVPWVLVLSIVGCNADTRAVVPASSVRVDAAPTAVESPLAPPAAPMIPSDPGAIVAGELDNAKVVELGKIALAIEADPAQIDDVLARHDMDRASFETAIAEVAKDSWKSDLYIATLGKR